MARRNRYIVPLDGGGDLARPRIAVAVVSQDQLDAGLTEAVDNAIGQPSGYLAINNPFTAESSSAMVSFLTGDLMDILIPYEKCN